MPARARSPGAWARELTEALARAPEHLSLYQLTIEPDTMFEQLYRAGKLKIPKPDVGRDLWDVDPGVDRQRRDAGL